MQRRHSNPYIRDSAGQRGPTEFPLSGAHVQHTGLSTDHSTLLFISCFIIIVRFNRLKMQAKAPRYRFEGNQCRRIEEETTN